MTTIATLAPGSGLSESDRRHLQEWQAKMKARDAASQPERDAAVVLQELQRTIATFSKIREEAYESRNRLKASVKREGGKPNFDSRSYLAFAEGDILAAEAMIRSATAAIKEWAPIAARQRKTREERQERERKLDAAERKLKGLGLD